MAALVPETLWASCALHAHRTLLFDGQDDRAQLLFTSCAAYLRRANTRLHDRAVEAAHAQEQLLLRAETENRVLRLMEKEEWNPEAVGKICASEKSGFPDCAQWLSRPAPHLPTQVSAVMHHLATGGPLPATDATPSLRSWLQTVLAIAVFCVPLALWARAYRRGQALAKGHDA